MLNDANFILCFIQYFAAGTQIAQDDAVHASFTHVWSAEKGGANVRRSSLTKPANSVDLYQL